VFPGTPSLLSATRFVQQAVITPFRSYVSPSSTLFRDCPPSSIRFCCQPFLLVLFDVFFLLSQGPVVPVPFSTPPLALAFWAQSSPPLRPRPGCTRTPLTACPSSFPRPESHLGVTYGYFETSPLPRSVEAVFLALCLFSYTSHPRSFSLPTFSPPGGVPISSPRPLRLRNRSRNP